MEELRKAAEVNRRVGYQRAEGKLVIWDSGKRGRTIRKEDLLAFLVRDHEVEQRKVTCQVMTVGNITKFANFVILNY